MANRYSRRLESGITEHHSSRAELDLAIEEDAISRFASLLAVIGLVVGGVLANLALARFGGTAWPKFARFVCIVLSAITLSVALAHFAKPIRFACQWLLRCAIFGAVIFIIGKLIWRLI